MSDPIEQSQESKKPGRIESALTELSHKLTVVSDVSKEIGYLYEDVVSLNFEKIIERFKGIFVMGFLGLIMSKKEYETWKKERKDIKVSHVETTEVAGGLRPMLPDDHGIQRSFETVEEGLRKERFANMAPPTKDDYDVWYEKNGVRVKRGTKGCVKKWALKESSKNKDPKDIPSEFALKNGSSSLFEKTPTTYEEFEETVIKKIYPLETDRGKAIEKAAKFLSRCALGRFQILPSCHFDKMGWSIKGKEGLKNMYLFIKEAPRQAGLFQKIIGSTLERYHNDPIAVGISYYSGSAARAYLGEKKSGLLIEKYENGKKILAYKEGFSGKLNAEQRGGGTILSYANEVLREYERSAELGYNTFERTAMAVEWIESKGKFMNQIFSGQKGLELVRSHEIGRYENRVLKYPIHRGRLSYLSSYRSNESKVKPTVSKYEGVLVKETLKKALDEANKLAALEGYQIIPASGYRTVAAQKRIKAEERRKFGDRGNKWVGAPGFSWHHSGGAVDLALYKIGDDKNRLSAATSDEMKEEQRKPYNDLLEKYMNGAGFVRLENESWHFELGTIYWVKIMQQQGILPQGDARLLAYVREGNKGDEAYHQAHA